LDCCFENRKQKRHKIFCNIPKTGIHPNIFTWKCEILYRSYSIGESYSMNPTSKLRTWWWDLGANVFSSNIFASGSGMFLPWWQVQVNIFKVNILARHPFAAFQCHCYLRRWCPSNVLKIYVTNLHSRRCLHFVTKEIFISTKKPKQWLQKWPLL
jgi:hypothetical protein